MNLSFTKMSNEIWEALSLSSSFALFMSLFLPLCFLFLFLQREEYLPYIKGAVSAAPGGRGLQSGRPGRPKVYENTRSPRKQGRLFFLHKKTFAETVEERNLGEELIYPCLPLIRYCRLNENSTFYQVRMSSMLTLLLSYFLQTHLELNKKPFPFIFAIFSKNISWIRR